MNEELNECRLSKLEAINALQMLVSAKDYKDNFGKDGLYEEMKSEGWAVARTVLDKEA